MIYSIKIYLITFVLKIIEFWGDEFETLPYFITEIPVPNDSLDVKINTSVLS